MRLGENIDNTRGILIGNLISAFKIASSGAVFKPSLDRACACARIRALFTASSSLCFAQPFVQITPSSILN